MIFRVMAPRRHIHVLHPPIHSLRAHYAQHLQQNVVRVRWVLNASRENKVDDDPNGERYCPTPEDNFRLHRMGKFIPMVSSRLDPSISSFWFFPVLAFEAVRFCRTAFPSDISFSLRDEPANLFHLLVAGGRALHVWVWMGVGPRPPSMWSQLSFLSPSLSPLRR